jgi:hypothetical protein
MAYGTTYARVLLAAVSERDGRVYWIADRRPYSMAEIIDTIDVC